jgi:cytochrome c oxidase subunit IV
MSERVIQPPTYYAVFVALIVLTFLTVTAGFLDLGPWHTAVGLVFGAAKATLVILIFMHLLYSPRLMWIALAAGLFWLGIMIVLTLSDYLTRHWLSY